MSKIDAPKADLYTFIKNNNYHRMTDKDHAVVLLQRKFSNQLEEIYYVLEDAIQSENPSKIYELDAKYGYGGTISNMYKVVKPK
jgi:hypothetical protein